MSSESNAVASVPSAAEQATPVTTPPSAPPGWPPLQTKRLVVLPLNICWGSHVRALNDKEHMRYSEQRRRFHDRETQYAYLESANERLLLLDLQERSPILYSIGSMSCHIDPDNKVVDLGIMIIPSEANKGYGTEAWRAVMNEWLKRSYKVEAGCMYNNFPMRDVMIECGMEYEGTRARHYLLEDGTRTDWVLYGRAP